MKFFLLLFALAGCIIGCTDVIVEDDVIFACEVHEDCGEGWKCSSECSCIEEINWDGNECE